MKRSSLLSCVHNGAKNLEILKKIYKWLDTNLEIEKISSVYEVQGEQAEGDAHHYMDSLSFMGQSLCFVCLVNFKGEAKQLKETIKKLEEQANEALTKEYIQLDLLSLENEISMLPSLTIPHPDLHLRAEFLIPASEINPTFEHPVLEKTLLQLEGLNKHKGHVHFYAQSKSLADFT